MVKEGIKNHERVKEWWKDGRRNEEDVHRKVEWAMSGTRDRWEWVSIVVKEILLSKYQYFRISTAIVK